jgi:Invasion associated locus B (IalB) protein
MRTHRRWPFVLSLLIAAAFAVSAGAQQQPAPSAPAAAARAPAPAKHRAKHAAKPKPAAATTAKPAAAVAGGAKPTLLGQYGEWGAYTASPGDKKICFAIAKPISSETKPPDRPRNPPYMFISTRPADKVTNEVSIIIGYPFKPHSEATVEVGTTTFALYTQGDGAWIKNAAEESHMVDAMRAGERAVVKGVSAKGTQTTDTFSLKGLSQALDRTEQECK